MDSSYEVPVSICHEHIRNLLMDFIYIYIYIYVCVCVTLTFEMLRTDNRVHFRLTNWCIGGIVEDFETETISHQGDWNHKPLDSCRMLSNLTLWDQV